MLIVVRAPVTLSEPHVKVPSTLPSPVTAREALETDVVLDTEFAETAPEAVTATHVVVPVTSRGPLISASAAVRFVVDMSCDEISYPVAEILPDAWIL